MTAWGNPAEPERERAWSDAYLNQVHGRLIATRSLVRAMDRLAEVDPGWDPGWGPRGSPDEWRRVLPEVEAWAGQEARRLGLPEGAVMASGRPWRAVR